MVSVAHVGGGGRGWGGVGPLPLTLIILSQVEELALEWVMVSPILLPSTAEIDEAGRKLVALRNVPERESEWLEAVHVVDQWRRAHSEPLRTFQVNLRRRVKSRGIVATRLKRLPTIIGKLERLQRLRLSQLQDIGGCRVVESDTDRVFGVATSLLDSRILHRLIKRDNYIAAPRRTGYRGIHLVYEYQSNQRSHLNGLNVEIQLRTRLQHQWATAVETVGAFTSNDLKSGRGDRDWLRFFALMSTAIARTEGMPLIPNTPTGTSELADELRSMDTRLGGVLLRLDAFRHVTRMVPHFLEHRASWLVLELDIDNRVVRGRPFKANESEAAQTDYLRRELTHRGNPQVDVVLVTADSFSALRRAYPNYFANLTDFRNLVQEELAGR